jgi:hypothetical protein
MERDYASVYAGENRLHDEPALFFHEYLKTPLQRTSEEIKNLIEKALGVLHQRIAKLEANILLTEERCQDEDWNKTTLDLTYYLFWLDENKAWQWLVPRFVEAWAYSRDLRRGLLAITEEWKKDYENEHALRLAAEDLFKLSESRVKFGKKITTAAVAIGAASIIYGLLK